MSEKRKLPESVRRFLSKCGSKGGKAGSIADKQKAGKLGYQAMIKSIAAKEESKTQ